jgi:hypothetical protein
MEEIKKPISQESHIPTSRASRVLDRTSAMFANKRLRSIFFLIFSFSLILTINSLLPVMEGESHYTARQVEVTYGEYKQMKAENENYRLTWLSEQNILKYVERYRDAHPELTLDELMSVVVPDTFAVDVYTRFFFQHLFWYTSTAISVGSAIILFYSFFNFMITREKEKHFKYLKLTDTLNDLVEENLDPVSFEPWMEDTFNPRRKIAQHRANVKYMLDRLERRTSYGIKRKLRPYFDALRKLEKTKTADSETSLVPYSTESILANLGPLTKREMRYVKMKERYLALLEDAYIEEYVLNGRVKYFKYVYPMFVYNGENSFGRTIDSYSLIKTDTKRISSDVLNKAFFLTVITLLFAVTLTITVISSYQQDPFWIAINVISKISPLIIQIPFAVDYSNNFMNTHLIGNLLSRRSIALLYLADRQGGASNA